MSIETKTAWAEKKISAKAETKTKTERLLAEAWTSQVFKKNQKLAELCIEQALNAAEKENKIVPIATIRDILDGKVPELYTLPQAEMESGNDSKDEEPSPEFGREVQGILDAVRSKMNLSPAQSPVLESKKVSIEEKPKDLKEFQGKVHTILAEIQTKIRELQTLEEALVEVSAQAA